MLAADIAKIQRPLRHALTNDQAIMVDDEYGIAWDADLSQYRGKCHHELNGIQQGKILSLTRSNSNG